MLSCYEMGMLDRCLVFGGVVLGLLLTVACDGESRDSELGQSADTPAATTDDEASAATDDGNATQSPSNTEGDTSNASDPVASPGTDDPSPSGPGEVDGEPAVNAGDSNPDSAAQPDATPSDAPDVGQVADAGAANAGVPWPPPTESSDASVGEARTRFEALQECNESSSPCGVVTVDEDESGAASYDDVAARCVLGELSQGTVAFFGHVFSRPGVDGLEVQTSLQVHPAGLVEVTTRQISALVPVEQYSAQLCFLAPSAVFDDCLSTLSAGDGPLEEAPACLSPEYWFDNCLELDETSIPMPLCP